MRTSFAFAAMLFAFALIFSAYAASIPGPWPALGHDKLHSWTGGTLGPEKISPLWSAPTGILWSSPAVDSAADPPIIIVGGDDNRTYGIRKSDGLGMWVYQTKTKFRSSPALVRDVALKKSGAAQGIFNFAYLGADDKKLYALDADEGISRANYTAGSGITKAGQPANFVGGAIRASPTVDLIVSFSKKKNETLAAPQTFPSSGIFFGDLAGYFYGVSGDNFEQVAGGAELIPAWVYTVGNSIYSSAVVDNDISAVVDTTNSESQDLIEADAGQAFASTAKDGTIKSLKKYSEVSIVIFGADNGLLYANGERSGANIWKYSTLLPIRSSPAVAKNLTFSYTNITGYTETKRGNIIFVGSDDKNVHAVSEYDGMPVWKFTTGKIIRSSPAVASLPDRKVVIVGSDDGKVYALDAAGNGDGTTTKIWEFKTLGSVRSSLVLDMNSEKVYFASCDGNIYGLNAAEGTQIFKKSFNKTIVRCGDNEIFPSPVLDGGIYFSSPTGGLIAYQSGQPDLEIMSILFSNSTPTAGDSINIAVNASNIGDGMSAANDIGVYVGDKKNSIQNLSVGALESLNSSLAKFSYSFSAAGNYSICAYADSGNIIEEANETNNEMCALISVRGPPDSEMPLIIQLKQSPESPKAGDKITISGSAGDNAGLSLAALQFFENGVWKEKGNQTLFGSNSTFNFSLGSEGAAGAEIKYRIIIADASGNSFVGEEKTLSIKAGGCAGDMPAPFNKTACSGGKLTRVDYKCNENTGIWEAGEAEISCALPAKQNDYLVWIGMVVVLAAIAGAIYFFVVKKRAPPKEPEEEPSEEGGTANPPVQRYGRK